MYRGGHSGSLVRVGGDFFLVLLRGCKVSQGFTGRGHAAAEVVIVHVYEEPAFGADPLSSVPVCACFDRVEMLFTGYPEQFVRVWERTVADLCPTAPAGAVGGMPQLLSGSVVVGNSALSSGKVQPLLVSTVAVGTFC